MGKDAMCKSKQEEKKVVPGLVELEDFLISLTVLLVILHLKVN